MKAEQTRDALDAVLSRMAAAPRAARRNAKLELGFAPAPWNADKRAHAIRHP